MRVAVSILLARGRESKEVLLVDRNPELIFFGGYQAFPGGTLEPEDAADREEIAPLCRRRGALHPELDRARGRIEPARVVDADRSADRQSQGGAAEDPRALRADGSVRFEEIDL